MSSEKYAYVRVPAYTMAEMGEFSKMRQDIFEVLRAYRFSAEAATDLAKRMHDMAVSRGRSKDDPREKIIYSDEPYQGTMVA